MKSTTLMRFQTADFSRDVSVGKDTIDRRHERKYFDSYLADKTRDLRHNRSVAGLSYHARAHFSNVLCSTYDIMFHVFNILYLSFQCLIIFCL